MKLTQQNLILSTALFFLLFSNVAFFKNVFSTYDITEHFLPLISIPIILYALFVFLLTLVSSKHTTKPIIILLLISSSLATYFMDTYNVIIDDYMIQNIAFTDVGESADLINFQIALHLIVLGLVPAIVVYDSKLIVASFKQEAMIKLKTIFISLSVILILLGSFSDFYASFFREHKVLRFYTNPSYYVYSGFKYLGNSLKHRNTELKKIGQDANIAEDFNYPKVERELVILVVGETARADRFSLNGYERETNPLLKQEDIINFSKVSACGTSTVVSVPCMFSLLTQTEFNNEKASSQENILDVLKHTKKVEILWRDNNSDSKGVADRITFQDFKSPKRNKICDTECRDEGMLLGLDDYIEQHSDKDILIILHQMGNHGPAYYKRYPKAFEKFTPVCKTNQLEACTVEEISNAYDNAILYTDYFLTKTIHFLKQYSDSYETAMIYISDHGESLGENGLYLHGYPYFLAPQQQKHVPALVWLDGLILDEIDIEHVKRNAAQPSSHDNLFHALLGLFEVDTTLYKPEMDILKGSILAKEQQ